MTHEEKVDAVNGDQSVESVVVKVYDRASLEASLASWLWHTTTTSKKASPIAAASLVRYLEKLGPFTVAEPDAPLQVGDRVVALDAEGVEDGTVGVITKLYRDVFDAPYALVQPASGREVAVRITSLRRDVSAV